MIGAGCPFLCPNSGAMVPGMDTTARPALRKWWKNAFPAARRIDRRGDHLARSLHIDSQECSNTIRIITYGLHPARIDAEAAPK